MKFHPKYFLSTIIIFLIEVLIATVFKNIVFVRAFLGDVLVVILIYTFIKSFFDLETNKLIIGVFVFACLIEFAQYFHFAELLGFQNNKIAMIVLGNSFSWIDILCYGIGCLIIFLINKTTETT